MRRPLLLLIGGFLFILTSCRPEDEPVSLELPATPVLTSEAQWGVANQPYLKILETTDPTSEVRGLLRRGDIVRIVSKAGAADGRSYWLEIKSPESDTTGWIPDDSMDVYDSPAQARTARGGMGLED